MAFRSIIVIILLLSLGTIQLKADKKYYTVDHGNTQSEISLDLFAVRSDMELESKNEVSNIQLETEYTLIIEIEYITFPSNLENVTINFIEVVLGWDDEYYPTPYDRNPVYGYFNASLRSHSSYMRFAQLEKFEVSQINLNYRVSISLTFNFKEPDLSSPSNLELTQTLSLNISEDTNLWDTETILGISLIVLGILGLLYIRFSSHKQY